MERVKLNKDKGKICLLEPIYKFGDYSENHSGCRWCEKANICKKIVERRDKNG